MCTLSWLRDGNDLHVFFNRDESRLREKAIPPAVDPEVTAVYPRDPEGSGTWISGTRESVLCLLNNYQAAARTSASRRLSRGHVILRLLQQGIEPGIDGLPLERMAPFFVCEIPLEPTGERCWSWDGRTLELVALPNPCISSGVELAKVIRSRRACFASEDRVADRLRIHASHIPEASAYSVCMHRDDAHTVSFSHLHLSDRGLRFDYTDRAPCKTDGPTHSLILPR